MAVAERFRWLEGWAQLPDEPSAREGWMHTGVVVTRTGEVVVGHPGEPALLFFDGGVRRVPVPELLELHGLALVEEEREERLWLADNGTKFRVEGAEVTPVRSAGGAVVQVDLGGRVLRRLARPDRTEYADARYSPTSVAVDEERHGGSGDVWVADGYGGRAAHVPRRGRPPARARLHGPARPGTRSGRTRGPTSATRSAGSSGRGSRPRP